MQVCTALLLRACETRAKSRTSDQRINGFNRSVRCNVCDSVDSIEGFARNMSVRELKLRFNKSRRQVKAMTYLCAENE